MRDSTRQELLKLLKEPRTVHEVAEYFNVHYQTAWNWLKELKKRNEINELPIKEAGRVQYMIGPRVQEGVLLVRWRDEVKELGWILGGLHVNSVNIERAMQSVLASIYCWAHYKDSDMSHLAGSFEPVQIKQMTRQLRDRAHNLVRMLDSALDSDRLWESKAEVAELFGKVDPALMSELASAARQQYSHIETGGRSGKKLSEQTWD